MSFMTPNYTLLFTYASSILQITVEEFVLLVIVETKAQYSVTLTCDNCMSLFPS